MLVSAQESLNLKLGSIGKDGLVELLDKQGLGHSGSVADIIKALMASGITSADVDGFIKSKYEDRITDRRNNIITDEDLSVELNKISDLSWGVVQGQLDQLIQTEYVRKFPRYDDLVRAIRAGLYGQVESYASASWYNHWTTVLIEDHISAHPNIVPTLKNNFGVDVFIENQPFDLKVTYLPKNYPNDLNHAIEHPQELAVWMYENQGEQRFGIDNRLFVVLADKNNLEDSWKLKRDFNFLFSELDNFFDSVTINDEDEITFSFKRKTYTTVSKIVFIAK